MDFLQSIIARKKEYVRHLKQSESEAELEARAAKVAVKDFREAITSQPINIIGEIKRASPSKGVIVTEFEVSAIASEYAQAGAVALSVLTETDFFLGDPEFVNQAKRASGLPVLFKDFILERFQLFFARAKGADAVLLIAKLHGEPVLRQLREHAGELGMASVIEVHDEKELEIALQSGAEIIGINNRNLTDFTVDLKTSERLARLVPGHIIKIAESGIHSSDDVKRLRQSGFDCFLVGESLLRSPSRAALLNEMRQA